MRVTSLPVTELSDSDRAEWCAHLADQGTYPGPCFHPDMVRNVGKFLSGVEVAVLEDETRRGFFSFLRGGERSIACAVPFCDYQGVIGPKDFVWDMGEVLRQLGLVAWDFDSLIGLGHLSYPSAFLRPQISPRFNREKSQDSHLGDKSDRESVTRSLATRSQCAERELGPLRFVSGENPEQLLPLILDWKAKRFKWTTSFRSMTEKVLFSFDPKDEGPQPVVCSLYAGQALLAAHFGLRYQGVLHYWFPAFDSRYSHLKPGRLLIREMVSHLGSLEATVLDFGPGGEAYKAPFANDGLAITSGGLELFSRFTVVRKVRRTAMSMLRSYARVR